MRPEKPILFSGPMVRAILGGRKTQTRRVIRNPERYENIRECGFCCPYGVPGDRLWVRETWRMGDGMNPTNDPEKPTFRADWPDVDCVSWRPSIFMPKKYARIRLEITEVRVQRVQEITEEDALAEGIRRVSFQGIPWYYIHENGGPSFETARDAFAVLWDSINAKRGYSWESNPWVWALTFQRADR